MKNHIVFLLDETGSMFSCKDDTVGGFNNFIKEQKKNDIKFTMTLFNSSKVERRHVDEPIKNVKKLSPSNYNPSCMTPLWDAIGSTINSLPKQKNVLFVIMTDGFENCSREFNSKSVKNLIGEKQKKKGWKFMFLGADIDNFSDADNLGINKTFLVQKNNMVSNYASLSASVTNYCETGEV